VTENWNKKGGPGLNTMLKIPTITGMGSGNFTILTGERSSVSAIMNLEKKLLPPDLPDPSHREPPNNLSGIFLIFAICSNLGKFIPDRNGVAKQAFF
jgi:hypothetical protein